MRTPIQTWMCALAMVTALSVTAGEEAAPKVVIDTSMGLITVELDPERAPVTVANFLNYVDKGAYDGVIFHRVIAGFMIQGGGHLPNMDLIEGEGPIHNEADNGLKNLTGTIAMARMAEIDSASRQWFINVADNDSLDHSEASCTREQEASAAAAQARGLYKPTTCKTFGYAVFGKVVEGMEVVHAIELVPIQISQGYNDVPSETVMIRKVSRVAQ